MESLYCMPLSFSLFLSISRSLSLSLSLSLWHIARSLSLYIFACVNCHIASRPFCSLLFLAETTHFAIFGGKRRRIKGDQNVFLARFGVHFFWAIFDYKTAEILIFWAKMSAANRSNAIYIYIYIYFFFLSCISLMCIYIYIYMHVFVSLTSLSSHTLEHFSSDSIDL